MLRESVPASEAIVLVVVLVLVIEGPSARRPAPVSELGASVIERPFEDEDDEDETDFHAES